MSSPELLCPTYTATIAIPSMYCWSYLTQVLMASFPTHARIFLAALQTQSRYYNVCIEWFRRSNMSRVTGCPRLYQGKVQVSPHFHFRPRQLRNRDKGGKEGKNSWILGKRACDLDYNMVVVHEEVCPRNGVPNVQQRSTLRNRKLQV